MTDFKENSWGNRRVGTDNEDILNEWALASVPDLQAASFWDESTSASSEEEEETWDETDDETEDETPTILSPPASKTRVLEALMIYPVSSGVTALLERRDIYALALSCWAIFYALNIEDPISQCNIISRCLRMCHGPDRWGVPNNISALRQREHREILQEGKDVDVKACAKKNCWNDVCIYCRRPPPLESELRRRWICGNCLPGRRQNKEIPECSCASAGNIYCLDCDIKMRSDDNTYYDLSKDCNSDCIAAADITECKNGKPTVYYYGCWDCREMGEPPYDGAFICRWCNGRLPYTELIPWDIIPYSSQSCRIRPT